MNLAVTWNLPVVFVLENNGYAETTSPKFSARIGTENIADRARGFGMPAITVDGNDFGAVYEAAGEAIERARKGAGPSLLNVKPCAISVILREMPRITVLKMKLKKPESTMIV